MKQSNFTQAVILMLLIALAAASCGTSHPTSRYPDSRDYPDRYPPGHAKKVYGHKSGKVYAPGQQKKHRYNYPLVITRRAGMDLRRNRDGRYYYRNSDGFYYWQGYDGRLYMDERHLPEIEYDLYSYNDWKDRGRYNSGMNKQRRY